MKVLVNKLQVFNALLSNTGAIKGTSRPKFYNEIGSESLNFTR